MLRSILVGLDSTPSTNEATANALELASSTAARVTGVTVIDVPFLTAGEAAPIGVSHYKRAKDAKRLQQAQNESAELLKRFSDKCRAKGISHESLECRGEPYAELLKLTDTHDILVVGRDLTFHRDASEALSSTVARLVKDSPRPVLIASPRSIPGKSVVVAYDGSIPAMRALQMFVLLGIHSDMPIRLVSIDKQKSKAEGKAARAKSFLALHGLNAEALGVESKANPGEVLLAEVRRRGACLLVAGA